MGFLPNPAAPQFVNPGTLRLAPPASIDLSQYNPPVGDQGAVSSCVSWATGYYLRGWYANRDGYYPTGGTAGAGGFAPMYLYSQLVHGQNVGTYLKDNLNILQRGIDTRADYTQGDYDYTDLPTDHQTYNAAHYTIASYSDVRGPNLQNWIETSIASGNPVVLGIPVYDNFYNDFVGRSGHTTYINGVSGAYEGGHAVFASMYDANGLWIENSWGTGFGLNGYVELSWGFVNRYASEAVSEVPMPLSGPVPVVVGQAQNSAAATVRAAGFAVNFVSAPDPTCNFIGRVRAENPRWAVYGSMITLTIGARPRTPCP
jgi:hypothetical protein